MIIYSIVADTANGLVDETLLSQEIIASGTAVPAAGLINLTKIETAGDVLSITHTPSLGAPDSGVLNLVVAAHSGTALVAGIDTPGPTGDIIGDAINLHASNLSAHHVRYTDAEAIAASSGALDHHFRYTDAEASGVVVAVVTTGILEHANLPSSHHTRYTDTEAIAAASGALNHHARYTDTEASGVAVQVVTTGILEHSNLSSAHHVRYTDAEAIAAASGALDHHSRYTDAEASGIAVQVVTTGIWEHTNISSAHHTRYMDAEAIAAATGNVTLQTAYDASASGLIDLDSVRGPLTIQDAPTPLSSAFEIKNSAGTIDLFRVFGPVGGRQVEIGAHDSLISGSNEPIVRIGDQTFVSFEFWPTDRTFTSAPGSLMLFNGTYEYDFANNSFAALNLQATIEIRQSQFAFNGFLLFNNGLTMKNVNGVVANLGPGQTFIAQPTIQADGAGISMSQNRDFLSQPNFNTINAGTLTVATWTQVQLLGQINTGVTMGTRNAIQIAALLGAGGTLTTERGIRLENLNRGSTIIGIDSALTGTSKTFINHPGNSPCNFGGDVHINTGASLVLGTTATNRVELFRLGNGIAAISGVGGSNNEALIFDFDATTNVVDISTGGSAAGIEISVPEFVFGNGGLNPDGSNNWVMAWNPGARSTNVGGDYSDVLFSAAANVTVNHAIGDFGTMILNRPGATIGGGGSITNDFVLKVQTNPANGTNRFGLYITSNPVGGSGINAGLYVSAGLSRFDGRVDINNGIALGGGSAPTLGTIGGAGPTGVAQAQWVEIDVGGVPHWIPAWT